jgi:hypothetical protein
VRCTPAAHHLRACSAHWHCTGWSLLDFVSVVNSNRPVHGRCALPVSVPSCYRHSLSLTHTLESTAAGRCLTAGPVDESAAVPQVPAGKRVDTAGRQSQHAQHHATRSPHRQAFHPWASGGSATCCRSCMTSATGLYLTPLLQMPLYPLPCRHSQPKLGVTMLTTHTYSPMHKVLEQAAMLVCPKPQHDKPYCSHQLHLMRSLCWQRHHSAVGCVLLTCRVVPCTSCVSPSPAYDTRGDTSTPSQPGAT